MRSPRLLAAMLLAVLVLGAAPGSAESAVGVTEVRRDGGTATVTGTLAFAPQTEAVTVGGTKTSFGGQSAATPAADAAGTNVTAGRISALPDGSGLRFTWQLAGMPAQVPPEGVRYAWSFSIGGRQYQLQAKRTNLSSITTLEDPMGHLGQVRSQQSFFQLRGACVTNYFGTPGTAVAGCYHLAFLNGSFDVANRTVSIDLPYSTRDSIGRLVAPDFVPGARLEPLNTANMSISAGLQAVVTIASVNSYINDWNAYTAGRRVDLAIGRAGLAPAGLDYRFPATLSGDAFTGSVGGLNATNDTVYVRACTAVTCHYTSVPA